MHLGKAEEDDTDVWSLVPVKAQMKFRASSFGLAQPWPLQSLQREPLWRWFFLSVSTSLYLHLKSMNNFLNGTKINFVDSDSIFPPLLLIFKKWGKGFSNRKLNLHCCFVSFCFWHKIYVVTNKRTENWFPSFHYCYF